jgi:hypothetical protein
MDGSECVEREEVSEEFEAKEPLEPKLQHGAELLEAPLSAHLIPWSTPLHHSA